MVFIPFLACMDFGGGEDEGCESYEWDWSDGNPCEGVVCPPDDNECTREYCSGGSCRSEPVTNGRSCAYDGLSGVCVEGVCGENLCEDVVCDDEDVCTDDSSCDYVDGTCDYTPIVCDDYATCTEDACDPVDGCIFTAVEDGTECGSQGRVCVAGECVWAECNQGLCKTDAERRAQCDEVIPSCRGEDQCIQSALILICGAE